MGTPYESKVCHKHQYSTYVLLTQGMRGDVEDPYADGCRGRTNQEWLVCVMHGPHENASEPARRPHCQMAAVSSCPSIC